MHLLLAEDDAILANGLIAQLTAAKFTVQHAPNGPVAEYLATNQHFDIVLLDLGLPLVDGWTVLENLRTLRPRLPVVVLTALDRLDSRVAGLKAGADDYITKPFAFSELEARLHAVLRRANLGAADGEVAVGGLDFQRESRCALVNGESVELSPREGILLELLLLHTDKVVTKEQITSAWTSAGAEVGASNSTEVHIHRLRRKIEGAGLAIRTVRGMGYLLESKRPAARSSGGA